MQNRTYLVLMPTDAPTTPLYIDVTNPGSQSAPVTAGGDGAYYELRGRPLRVPVLAADGAADGFVPRCALGFWLGVTLYASALSPAEYPSVQLSESLIQDLTTTDTPVSINVPTFADQGGAPTIGVFGDTPTTGQLYLISLLVMEAKDEDRQSTVAP